MVCLLWTLVKVYVESDGLSHKQILSLQIDGLNRVWVGTQKGLNVIDGGVVNSFTKSNGIVNRRIKSIVIKDLGEVWIGTKDGLGRIEFWELDWIHLISNGLMKLIG